MGITPARLFRWAVAALIALSLALALLAPASAQSLPRSSWKRTATPEQFIEAVQPYALWVQETYGIPAAALIAQSALETGWGRYVSGNNLFGITRHGRLKKYPSVLDSFLDYVSVITKLSRYRLARSLYHNPEAYVLALKLAGYAEDPHYAEKIIKIMRDYDLIERFPAVEERL